MKRIMNVILLSCRRATELTEKKLLVGLNTLESTQLKVHKTMCSKCREYEKQSTHIEKALSQEIKTSGGKTEHKNIRL